ncbi:MAG: hypothetical protein LBM93_02680 [Oscillospiraceae bacterium]|jgi:hypothetical protein|nr:hypothetical protein [Oscillospiraceae bacterium]
MDNSVRKIEVVEKNNEEDIYKDYVLQLNPYKQKYIETASKFFYYATRDMLSDSQYEEVTEQLLDILDDIYDLKYEEDTEKEVENDGESVSIEEYCQKRGWNVSEL